MPRQNTTASLVISAKLEGIGWRRGLPVRSKNGRIVADKMLYDGKEHSISGGIFQIRFYENGAAKYVNAGTDFNKAQAVADRMSDQRQREYLDMRLGIKTPVIQEAKKLADLVDEYIAEKKSPSLGLSETSVRHYLDTLPELARIFGDKFITDVTEADVIRYMDSLITRGHSQKTRAMRYSCTRGFLRASDVNVDKLISKATHKRLSAKPDANVNPYTQAELDALLSP